MSATGSATSLNWRQEIGGAFKDWREDHFSLTEKVSEAYERVFSTAYFPMMTGGIAFVAVAEGTAKLCMGHFETGFEHLLSSIIFTVNMIVPLQYIAAFAVHCSFVYLRP